MQIFIFLAALLTGGLLGFFTNLNGKMDYQIARVYVIVASLLILNAALVNFVNIQNDSISAILIFVLNWGKSMSYFLIAFLIVHILKGLNTEINSSDGS